MPSRHSLRQAFFMAMEASWIATLLAFLDTVAGGVERPTAAWCLWLYPAAYAYARIEGRIEAHPLALAGLRLLLGGAGIAITLAAIFGSGLQAFAIDLTQDASAIFIQLSKMGPAPVILVIAASAFVIARGWLLGPRQIRGDGFLDGLQLGAVILLAVAFLYPLAGLSAVTAITGALAFMGSGLYGLWLCRWLDSDIGGRGRGGIGWPLVAAAIVAMVLVIGGLWGTEVDQGVVDWLLTPVFWLGDLINQFLLYLGKLMPISQPLGLEARPTMARPEMPPVDQPYKFGEITRLIGQVMLATSVTLLIVMLVARNLSDFLRWLSRRRRPARGIDYDASAFGLWDDLKEILAILRDGIRRLGRWLMRWRRPLMAGAPEALAVRHIYARLLARMARQGWPRAAGQTPHEYLETLAAVVPQLRPELALITEAYVGVRYGAVVPPSHQLDAVRNGWRRVRRAKPGRTKT